jgi:hypothetical protein
VSHVLVSFYIRPQACFPSLYSVCFASKAMRLPDHARHLARGDPDQPPHAGASVAWRAGLALAAQLLAFGPSPHRPRSTVPGGALDTTSIIDRVCVLLLARAGVWRCGRLGRLARPFFSFAFSFCLLVVCLHGLQNWPISKTSRRLLFSPIYF